jgi:hypothetical protein
MGYDISGSWHICRFEVYSHYEVEDTYFEDRGALRLQHWK